MSRIPTGSVSCEGSEHFYLRDASTAAVAAVCSKDEFDPNGRSQWVWIRLPNGDVALATFPQAVTYEQFEKEYP